MFFIFRNYKKNRELTDIQVELLRIQGAFFMRTLAIRKSALKLRQKNGALTNKKMCL